MFGQFIKHARIIRQLFFMESFQLLSEPMTEPITRWPLIRPMTNPKKNILLLSIFRFCYEIIFDYIITKCIATSKKYLIEKCPTKQKTQTDLALKLFYKATVEYPLFSNWSTAKTQLNIFLIYAKGNQTLAGLIIIV